MSRGCAVFIHLGLTLCDLSFSVLLTSFFVTVSEWVPFSVFLKELSEKPHVTNQCLSESISQSLFSSEAIIKTHWISFSVFYILILFNSMCVWNASFKAPVVCLNWFSELCNWVTQCLCTTLDSLRHTLWGVFSWELYSDVLQIPLHL